MRHYEYQTNSRYSATKRSRLPPARYCRLRLLAHPPPLPPFQTKCNNMNLPHKSLSKQSVVEQCLRSVEKLRVEFIDIFYLHGPDISTDIEETLDAIDELHKAGKFKEFGLSNYPSWKVTSIYFRCRERKMVLPTVYQGPYNAITRSVEFEATACFRELGIRSYHYNPLAGGLLTGKYEGIDSQLKDGGRL